MDSEHLLQEFEKHLRERRIVPDKHVLYHVRWVRDFLRFCGNAKQATSLGIETFVNMLEKRERIADWQIRQVHNAVSLFLQFRGKLPESGDPTTAKAEPGETREETWEKAIEEMHKLMRIKHYSARTEQSYCDWVRRFAKYLAERGGKKTPYIRSGVDS